MFKKSIILSSIIFSLNGYAESSIKLPNILNPEVSNHIHENQFKRTGPTIQIAILLDTSNSMDGLIAQTKSKIWNIINEVSKANKDDKNIDEKLNYIGSRPECNTLEKEANKLAYKLMDELKKTTLQYDIKTNHGVAQNAWL